MKKKRFFPLNKWYRLCALFIHCMPIGTLIATILLVLKGQPDVAVIGVIFDVILFAMVVMIEKPIVVFKEAFVCVNGTKRKRQMDIFDATQYKMRVNYEDIIGLRFIYAGNNRTGDFADKPYTMMGRLQKNLKISLEILQKNRKREYIFFYYFSKKQRIAIINELKARVGQYNDTLKDINAEQMVNDFYGKK